MKPVFQLLDSLEIGKPVVGPRDLTPQSVLIEAYRFAEKHRPEFQICTGTIRIGPGQSATVIERLPDSGYIPRPLFEKLRLTRRRRIKSHDIADLPRPIEFARRPLAIEEGCHG